MSKVKKFISSGKIISLHNSVKFLDHYSGPPKNVDEVIVGECLIYEKRNVEKTDLLKELGELNSKRKLIIEKLLKYN